MLRKRNIEIIYAPVFIRRFKKLEPSLQAEAFDKIELFKNAENHGQLGVHKLQGNLSDKYSFSVNYKVRIVFKYMKRGEAGLLDIGNHDVYK